MKIEDLFPGLNLETNNVEFKGLLSDSSTSLSWLKCIAGFANGDGGDLFVGVENKSHLIVSLSAAEADKQVLLIHQEIKQKLEPKINYSISSIAIKGGETRYILKINVKPSLVKPVFLHDSRAALVFVRDFGVTRLATSEEIRYLVLLDEYISYDAIITDEVYEEDDFKYLQKVANKNNSNSLSVKQLISIGFMDSSLKLSRGALLFKDNSKNSITRVDVSFYPSINKGERKILSTKTFTGNIIEVIDQAYEYIIAHSVDSWYKTDDYRINKPSYPYRSLKEGISNALCHRNYYITTSLIEINVFVDRLEIVSPGSLLGVKSIAKETNISSITPRRRNEVIARTLEAIHYVENKGSGFDLIEEEYFTADKNHKPYISCDSNYFSLTLPNLNYSKGIIDEFNDSPDVFVNDVSISERDLKILSYCYINRRTSSQIAKMLQITSSSYFRKNILGTLIEKQYLHIDTNTSYPTYLTNHELVKLTDD